MDNEFRRELIYKSPISYSGLKKLNIGAGISLFVEGILMLILGYLLDWHRDIYTFYLKFKILSFVLFQAQVLPRSTCCIYCLQSINNGLILIKEEEIKKYLF